MPYPRSLRLGWGGVGRIGTSLERSSLGPIGRFGVLGLNDSATARVYSYGPTIVGLYIRPRT